MNNRRDHATGMPITRSELRTLVPPPTHRQPAATGTVPVVRGAVASGGRPAPPRPSGGRRVLTAMAGAAFAGALGLAVTAVSGRDGDTRTATATDATATTTAGGTDGSGDLVRATGATVTVTTTDGRESAESDEEDPDPAGVNDPGSAAGPSPLSPPVDAPTADTAVPSPAATPTTAPTPTTAATPGVTASCFTPVLVETFDGSSLDTSRWQPYDSPGNAGHGLRRPSAITVGDGMLTITAEMIDGQLVSGGMRHHHVQTYGRYEVRVRTGADPSGTMSGVVLTWPDSQNQPRDGENDLYETVADRDVFHSFIHKPGGTPDQQDHTLHPVDATVWHTLAMEWTPDVITLWRDGELVKTLTETGADLVPDAGHFAAIQLDAWADRVEGPVTMQVDSITVSSWDPAC